MKLKSVLRVSAATMALAATAHAGEADDLSALKAEIAALKEDYGAKIEALEARLRAAEEKAAASNVEAAVPTPAVETAPAPVIAETAPVERTPISQNAYNPGISVVLNGGYTATNRDAEDRRIHGFPLDEEAGAPDRGFTLGESEVTLNANIDHRLYGNLTFALTDDGEIEIEDAYIQTISLPAGFTLKGGKFLSGVAYLNENHAHNWDFIDVPLPYRAFLGGVLSDAGVQVRWIAPTDFYLEFGGEVLRGDSFPAGGAASKGAGTLTGFVQTGGDIGVSSSWLAKLSYVRAKSEGRFVEGNHFFDSVFTGRDRLGIVSIVYKWAPGGNASVNNLIVNGEYFFANERGQYPHGNIDRNRSGFYAQAVYQFQPRWRAGLRYARLMSEPVPAGFTTTALNDFGHSPDAISGLLEFDTSEFSRFRIMYTYDNSDLTPVNEFLARYTVIFGPHGAHRF